MKINASTDIVGTLDGAEPATECSFDPDGAAHLMSVLSNMYRDKHMAVLREYAANARDAHIQAGNPDPIAITLPTEWNPTLLVEDHGVGLDRDQILSVYSKYGPSTKRGGNDQVGGFGIGAKSAFTIASQFIVTGVKDGFETTALFALNGEGVGTVKILSRASTDKANGVTVNVAVDDAAAMRRAATTLFSTWEPGSVLVDGKTPRYLPDTMLHVNDALYARHRDPGDADERTGVTVVMGGIPYEASEPLLRAAAKRTDGVARTVLNRMIESRFKSALHLLALVPIGEVDITPSREDLRDTPRTIATLVRIVTDFVNQRASAVKRALDAEPTEMHAATRLSQFKQFLVDLTWQGAQWRDRWLAPEVTLPFPQISLNTDRAVNRTESTLNPTVKLGESFDGTVVITNVDADATKTVKRLANRFMTHTGTKSLILAPDTRGNAGWFAYGRKAPIATLSFTDFKAKAAALPKVSAGRTPTYDVYRSTTSTCQQMTCQQIADAEAGGARILFAPQPFSSTEIQLAIGALLPTDLLIVLYGMQTESALHKRFPAAAPAEPIILDHARRILDAMTEQERLALEFDKADAYLHPITDLNELAALEPVRRFVDLAAARRDAYKALPASRYTLLQHAKAVVKRHDDVPAVNRSTGFPLLDMTLDALLLCGAVDSRVTYNSRTHEHLTRYLDAVRDQKAGRAA